MRDTTPFASFLPLNGYIMVLQHTAQDDELFPDNLRNKPLFAVNGGRDPLYPTAAVEPTLERLSKGGVTITYKPQPQAVHNTAWWPEVKDAYEAFVREHPRVPLPDTLTWETADPHRFGRAHWLQIDAIGPTPNESHDLPDLNVYTGAPRRAGTPAGAGPDGGSRDQGSMAARLGLERNDVIQQWTASRCRQMATW